MEAATQEVPGITESVEERLIRLTDMLRRAGMNDAEIGWYYVGMHSEGEPIWQLELDGHRSSVTTSVADGDFLRLAYGAAVRLGVVELRQAVADVAATINGWDRGKLMWYGMGRGYQLRLGRKNIPGCHDYMTFDEALDAALGSAKKKWVTLC